ncbi:MAG: hypothetical protein GY838_05605 [bacterium]|nr:hypothetical protein [bacterium]
MSLVTWRTISADFALGVFLTALWATIGFRALEGILRAGVKPPGQAKDDRGLLVWGAVKIVVYGLAIWVLFSRPFPPLSHAVGFTLMMVVLVVVSVTQRVQQRPATPPRQEDDAHSDDGSPTP